MRYLSAVIMMGLLLACERSTMLDHQVRPAIAAEASGESNTLPMTETDERVVAPTNISGSYLLCREVVVPFDKPESQAIGCGFYSEAAGTRIETASFARNIDWSYEATAFDTETAITVYASTPEQKLAYDVYYTFVNPRLSIQDFVKRLTIAMDVTDLSGTRQSYQNNEFATPPSGAVGPGTEAPGTPLPDIFANP